MHGSSRDQMRDNVLLDARIFLVSIPCMRRKYIFFYDYVVGPEVTIGMIRPIHSLYIEA